MTFHPHKPLYAPRGVVATSQPLAASAGLGVLRRGGNAVDAAVATAIALTVVQPGSNDIGGDLFAIVWDGTRLHGLNASGRSPAALSLDAVRDGMPERGWLPVTVPGAPAGWWDLHARFGALPFAELFADAIGYAERGYPVSPEVARAWGRSAAVHARLDGEEFAEWGRVFTVPGGGPPRAGERWANPAAARTLRLIADSAADAFYTGEIAAALAGHAARTGGLLTATDLAAHTSTWVDPIHVAYRDHEVWELPPNGQGIAALLALGILDGVDLAALPPVERLHWEIEAMKLGFADAFAYVADPDRVIVPTAELLRPEYAAARRAHIGARALTPAPGDPVRGGTVYLCAADADGMMVSLIQSNYMGFGSYVVLPGYGFGLQNRGLGFRLEPDHPNAVGPAKRPFHTIIPGFLTRDGEPVGPFGVMGGHMQPQGHLQVVTSTVDGGLDPQAALNAPRWYWQAGRSVLVEEGLAAPEVLAELERRGHEVTASRESAIFGYGQAIWRLPFGGYVAGSEPRADGCAMGY
ncbi:gamma-glutamyltransferase family protein [Phytohabitans rumicis]|uniref:Gamma-glutamyltransferase n=1 Tax=Phytohabitans rumicis TaxID=1076125 RepID=A0A6V8L0K9_9ACTN|nr:gamma-glutamyltransferase family protein [Phytohabitans rumicis]GFJ90843.1 gamma-glutamyltransferase [Phytohabitans rumicis]